MFFFWIIINFFRIEKYRVATILLNFFTNKILLHILRFCSWLFGTIKSLITVSFYIYIDIGISFLSLYYLLLLLKLRLLRWLLLLLNFIFRIVTYLYLMLAIWLKNTWIIYIYITVFIFRCLVILVGILFQIYFESCLLGHYIITTIYLQLVRIS